MVLPIVIGIVALGGLIFGGSGCSETPAPRGPIAKPEDDDGKSWWDRVDDDTPPPPRKTDPPRKTEDPPNTEVPPEVKPPVNPNDLDQDGYEMCKSPDELLKQVEEGVVNCDCNDDNMSINPGTADNVGDFAEYTDKDGNIVQVPDQNCDLVDGVDVDKDSHASVASGGKDCDDNRANVKPGGINRLNNKRDWDCDGEKGDLDLAKDTVRINGEITAMAMGDVDGDGLDDVVVGYTDGGPGKIAIYNGANLAAGDVKNFTYWPLAAQGDADVVIHSNVIGLEMGYALVVVDTDGDGKAEIISGVHGYNSEDANDPSWANVPIPDGAVFIGDGSASGGLAIFKGRANWQASMQVTSMEDPVVLAALKMDVVKGNNGEYAGQYIHVVDDFNGDGKRKIVMGNSKKCDAIPIDAIQGYQTKAAIKQNNPNSTYHFDYNNGTPFFSTFCGQVSSGNIDGDGVPDIVFGDSYDPSSSGGRALLIKGSQGFPHDVNLHTLQAYPGLKFLQFEGHKEGYGAGHWVDISNVNGQGLPELLVGVRFEDDPFVGAGKVFCVPGDPIKQIWQGNPLQLANGKKINNGSTVILNGDVYDMGGMAIQGDIPKANIAGWGLSATGDVDGDGANDFFAGAATYGGTDQPTFVSKGFHFSGAGLMAAAINGNQQIPVSSADMTISTAPSSGFGKKVVGGGDINGDGVPDLLVYSANQVGEVDTNGFVSVLFGGN